MPGNSLNPEAMFEEEEFKIGDPMGHLRPQTPLDPDTTEFIRGGYSKSRQTAHSITETTPLPYPLPGSPAAQQNIQPTSEEKHDSA